MNTGIVKSKASGIALMGKVLVGVMVVGAGLMPFGAKATTTNDQFRQYVWDICTWVGPLPAGWTIATHSALCAGAFPGTYAANGVGANVSANLGISAAGDTSKRKKKNSRENLQFQNEKPQKGASGDGGRWGLLVTPQFSKSNRTETDLENGYKSNLKGLVIGLDYRYSDNLVAGIALGNTKDEAVFLNGAGLLKSSNNTVSFYSTWLMSEKLVLDGYIGYGKLNLDNERNVVFESISGQIRGKTAGKQVSGGFSVNYQTNVSQLNLSPFINVDYIKTNIDGYAETGGTLLELRYKGRSNSSLTSSLGARIDSSYGFEWGALIPSVRLAAVHEFQNKAKQIENELVITPGFSLKVATDSPDRNYLNLGFGMAAALNGGAQLFLDYEKRTQDRLLSSWAVSLGGLFEF